MEALRNQERDPIIHEANVGYFSDDELQDWCEESAFGIKHRDKRFPTAKAQMESFDKALLDVM